jgi:hypothetical protein
VKFAPIPLLPLSCHGMETASGFHEIRRGDVFRLFVTSFTQAQAPVLR